MHWKTQVSIVLILIIVVSDVVFFTWERSFDNRWTSELQLKLINGTFCRLGNITNDFVYVSGKPTDKVIAVTSTITSQPPDARPDFRVLFGSLNWTFVEAYFSENKRLPPEWLQEWMDALTPLIEYTAAPLVNTSHPQIVVNCQTEEYDKWLTGNKRQQPIKLYDITNLAYDLDILEIRLFELENVVDEFAVMEGAFSMVGIRKPLFLARNRQRFQRWNSKLRHFVWDDRMILSSSKQDGQNPDLIDWDFEIKNRQLAVQSFIDYHRNSFSPDDVFIIADVDEVPSEHTLAHLKYCEVRPDKLPGVIDSVFWRFNFHYREQDLYYPTLITWAQLQAGADYRTQLRPRIGYGWHLNRFGPAALQIMKEFSIAEGGLRAPNDDLDLVRNLDRVEALMRMGIRPCCPNDHLTFVSDPIAARFPIPWIVVQNKQCGRWDFL